MEVVGKDGNDQEKKSMEESGEKSNDSCSYEGEEIKKMSDVLFLVRSQQESRKGSIAKRR